VRLYHSQLCADAHADRFLRLNSVHDGWGISDIEEGNAVKGGDTTTMDDLATRYCSRTLAAHGLGVGLSDGLMGNSEVGYVSHSLSYLSSQCECLFTYTLGEDRHLNIGAGRIVWQDIVRIDQSIKRRQFHESPKIVEAMQHAKDGNGRLHLLGLVSRSDRFHSSTFDSSLRFDWGTGAGFCLGAGRVA